MRKDAMKKACIFDLDGTLLDTLSTIGGYMNEALAKAGLPTHPLERYKYFAGNGVRLLVERALTEAGVMTKENYDGVFATYNRLYDNAPNGKTVPYPHILSLLAALKEKGIKTAVLSNKPDFATRAVVKELLGEAIDVAHGGREGILLKPAPDSLFSLLAELGVEKEECLYIGDTGVDMDTAAAAGVFSIGVTWGFRDEAELSAHGACAIVHDPLEILSYL